MPKEPPPSSQDDTTEKNRAGTLIEPLVPDPIREHNAWAILE